MLGNGGTLLDVDFEVVCCQDQSPPWKHACYGDGLVVGRFQWDTPVVFSFIILHSFGSRLLLHRLYITALLLRLLPWFSALRFPPDPVLTA